MSVTINTTGTFSRQIVISGETSPTGIIAAVNTALTDLGWTLHDTISSGSLNCLTTKVYSAPNNDVATGGPTYKYMILRWDAPRQFWFVSCCESWDAVTNHTPTNECFTNGRVIPLPLQYDNCTLYVFASVRWAAFMGTVMAEPSAWQGVFEFEREAPEDTATLGIPCFGWTSSLNIGEPWSGISGTASTNYGSRGMVLSVPRTKSGATGLSAFQEYTWMTNTGAYPPNQYNGPVGNSDCRNINAHHSHLGSWNCGAYVWDTNKKYASTLKLAGWLNFSPAGRIYGLTVTSNPAAAILDTTDMPVDANKFFSAAGSTIPATFLGMSGGYQDELGLSGGRMACSTFNTGLTGYSIQKMMVIKGRWVYIINSSQTAIYKLDTVNGTTSSIVITNAPYDMIYDGNNYLYISSNSTIIMRVNITTEVSDSLTGLTHSTLCLAIDDTYLYAAEGQSGSTTPKITLISLSTFTSARVYTNATQAAAARLTVDCGDYKGYVYAAVTTGSSSTVSDNKIYKILASNVSVTNLTLPQSKVSSPLGFMYWDGYHFLIGQWLLSGTAVAINSITDALVSGLSAINTTCPLVLGGRSGSNINCVVPFKGYLCVPQGGAYSWWVYPNRLNVDSATTGGNTALQGSSNSTINSMVASSGVSALNIGCTDGCNLYSSNLMSVIDKTTGANGTKSNNATNTARILIPS